jgi:hypothetical protein
MLNHNLSWFFRRITLCLLAIAAIFGVLRMWPAPSPLRFSSWKLWACAVSWLAMLIYLYRAHLVMRVRSTNTGRRVLAAPAFLLALFSVYVAAFEGLWGLARALWDKDLLAAVGPICFVFLGWKLMGANTAMTYDTLQTDTAAGIDHGFASGPLIKKWGNVLGRSGYLRKRE